jgi:hypothetical protein
MMFLCDDDDDDDDNVLKFIDESFSTYKIVIIINY